MQINCPNTGFTTIRLIFKKVCVHPLVLYMRCLHQSWRPFRCISMITSRKDLSPVGDPILFVKKKDDSLCLCVDYRGLNKLNVRNRYPLPLISELLDQLRVACVFSKVDMRGAYNLICIKPGDDWKTAVWTRYGHFEYKIMPFGLTNAPPVFQHMMNDIFQEYLNHFVVIYLDDILSFLPNMEEHTRQVWLVLAKLCEHGFYAKGEICEFTVLLCVSCTRPLLALASLSTPQLEACLQPFTWSSVISLA